MPPTPSSRRHESNRASLHETQGDSVRPVGLLSTRVWPDWYAVAAKMLQSVGVALERVLVARDHAENER